MIYLSPLEKRVFEALKKEGKASVYHIQSKLLLQDDNLNRKQISDSFQRLKNKNVIEFEKETQKWTVTIND